LGIVFLEASAMELPVIAGDSGGAPEAVLDGATGLVVDGRDVDAITAGVVGLLTDPARSKRWGQAGREWITKQWNWQSSADRLAELLST
jgi:phosphatidylinositol alpha-1,6-mannosyltransferase